MNFTLTGNKVLVAPYDESVSETGLYIARADNQNIRIGTLIQKGTGKKVHLPDGAVNTLPIEYECGKKVHYIAQNSVQWYIGGTLYYLLDADSIVAVED